jgi:hypothetical protein
LPRRDIPAGIGLKIREPVTTISIVKLPSQDSLVFLLPTVS